MSKTLEEIFKSIEFEKPNSPCFMYASRQSYLGIKSEMFTEQEWKKRKPKGVKMLRHVKFEREILFEDGTIYYYYFNNGVKWLYKCQMIIESNVISPKK